jgi:UDP-perosamine 4-acetyltransferase
MKGIVVIGAGGHAKVAIETLRAAGESVACCVADEGAADLGVPLLKGDEQLLKLRAEGHTQAIIAIGDNLRRAQLAEKILAAGYELVSVISRHAVISHSAKIGHGVVVMPGAIINAGAVIEDLVIINSGAVVEHDSKVGYAAHLGPQSGLAGGVTVGRLAFLGIGAKVIPGVKIGAGTIIGAGAVVIEDLPDHVTAVGVPARVVKAIV